MPLDPSIQEDDMPTWQLENAVVELETEVEELKESLAHANGVLADYSKDNDRLRAKVKKITKMMKWYGDMLRILNAS